MSLSSSMSMLSFSVSVMLLSFLHSATERLSRIDVLNENGDIVIVVRCAEV